MNKLKFLPILLLWSISSAAQSLVFKSVIKPDTRYVMTSTSNNDMEMDFAGDKSVFAKLDAGAPLETRGSSTTETVMSIVTGSMVVDKGIPATLRYEKSSVVSLRNGTETKRDSPLSGTVMKGHYTPNHQFKIDSIISDKMNETMKTFFMSTFKDVQQIAFPETPLKVGDTFERQLPMQIPIPGMNPMNAAITSTYTLKALNDDKATFDISQSITLANEDNGRTFNVSGTGSGISEFDIRKQMISTYDADLITTMKVSTPANNIASRMKTKLKYQMEVN